MASAMPAALKKSVEDTKVSYTQLGKSGLRVSVPILGAMSFGSSQWQDCKQLSFFLCIAASCGVFNACMLHDDTLGLSG